MVLSINPMTPVCGSVLLYLATVLTFLFMGKTGGVKNEQGVMPMRYPFSFPACQSVPREERGGGERGGERRRGCQSMASSSG